MQKISYASLLLLLNTLSTSNANENTIIQAQPSAQILHLANLTHTTPNYYIVSNATTSAIEITVQEVFIGNGHGAFNYKCEQNFIGGFQITYLMISDTNNPTEDYLVVCDNEVKNKWKKKTYCSSNVTIHYQQIQKNYLGYHSTIEYREIPNACHRSICNKSVDCVPVDQRSGYHGIKYLCKCLLDCGKTVCKNPVTIGSSHQANKNKATILPEPVDNSTRQFWNLTAKSDEAIILNLTLDPNRDQSNIPHYVIQLIDTKTSNVYVVDNADLQKGIKWISNSETLIVICDHPPGENILMLEVFKEPLKSIQYINASPNVYSLKVGEVSKNVETTTVWHIKSDEDHFLNVDVSLKDPLKTHDENSTIQIINNSDEHEVVIVHLTDLNNGTVHKQVSGKNIRVECYPSTVCKTDVEIRVQKQPLRYYQHLEATDSMMTLDVNDTGTDIDTTNIWEVSTDENHYLKFYISLKKPFVFREKRRAQYAYVKFRSPLKRADANAIVFIGDLSSGTINKSFPCSNVTVECFPSKLCKEYINIEFIELLSSDSINAGKTAEIFRFQPDRTTSENIVSITTGTNAIEVNFTLRNPDEVGESGYIEVNDNHGRKFNLSKTDILSGKTFQVIIGTNITIICHYVRFCQNLIIERRGILLQEYCKQEPMDAPFSHHTFLWPDTPIATTAHVNCPVGYNGKVNRYCNSDNQWEKPDYTNCVSREILRICNETESISQNDIVDPEHFNNLTARLANATSIGRCLYPGDLTTVARTVNNLAEIVKNTTSDHSSLSKIAQGYGDAVNNIVDLGLANVWTYTSKTFVKSNMLVILESVERLSENVAKKKLEAMSRYKREITKYTQKDTVHVEAKNLEFDITFHERLAICEDSTVLSFDDTKTGQVTLSSSVFKTAVRNSPDRFIQVYTARFSSVSSLIETSIATTEGDGSKPFINTDIVSSKILNVPQNRFQHLEKPVIILFELRNKSEIPDLKEKCVFLNMSSGENNTWSPDGCSVDSAMTNGTHVACRCTHLTNFAVLMDVFEVQEKIDYTDYTILTYISYIGGVMSVLACVITVIVFQYFSLRKERVLVHQQLALSIVFAQVFFLVGIDRTENHYACTVMAALIHYSLMSMFCWMLIEGVHLYIMLVKVFRRRGTFRKYLLFGWGFPLLVVGISVGVLYDEYGGADRCWLSHKVLLWIFVPVVSLVVVINTIILIIVLRIMMKSMLSRANSEERSAIKAGLKAAAILLPLLGITWTLGFLSVNNKEALIFTYLFTICNSLQGVFFFIFHCLLNTDVRNAFERRSQRRTMRKILTESLQHDSRSRKTSTLNTSKSSINSILTDDTYLAKKKWNKITNNDFDRIHREHVATMGDRNYHLGLQKSFSDGIQQQWQNITKEFAFYNGKDNINILHGNGTTAKEIQDGYITDVVLKDHKEKDFRIEDLYAKPKRKRTVSEENKENNENNRVRFNGQSSEQKETQGSEDLKDALVQELKQRLE